MPITSKKERVLVTPNEEFVDAIVTQAVYVSTWQLADQHRHQTNQPITTMQGAVLRNTTSFLPPEHLQSRSDISIAQKRYWSRLADMIIATAQDNSITPPVLEEAGKLGAPVMSDIRISYAVRDLDAHVYFEVDTDQNRHGVPPTEGAEKVKAATDFIIEKIRKGVEDVLRDGGLIETMQGSLVYSEHIDARVIFEREIKRLKYIQAYAESPEDQRIFMGLLTKAVRVLGLADELEVEMMTPEESLLRGAKALYKHARPGARAKIAIPLSHHGTTEHLTIDEMFELIAHEVAHHQWYRPGKLPINTQAGNSHDMIHSALTQYNLQQLRSAKMKIYTEQDGGMAIDLIASDDVMQKTVAQMVTAEIDRRLAARASTQIKSATTKSPAAQTAALVRGAAPRSTGQNVPPKRSLAEAISAFFRWLKSPW